ncbi:TPA: hypothetical protein DDW35_10855, partial [Candidatus Sumerlaeota bacterium]|nr:hypothetical protein [Candidatus Sumerlaeota bacterium]
VVCLYLLTLACAVWRMGGVKTLFSKHSEPNFLWRDALVLGCYSLTLASPLLETHHFTNCIPGWIFLFHDYLERRCGHVYFILSLFLWIGIFSAREMSGHAVQFVISPMYCATFCLLFLWLITILHILFFLEKTTKVPVYSNVGSDNAV